MQKDSTVSFAVDASGLSEGLHTVSYRLKDNAGHYGRPETEMFYRLPMFSGTTSVVGCEYWIDEDIDKKKTSSAANGVVSLKAVGSHLMEGIHTLNYRLKDNTGRYGAVQSWLFYRSVAKPTKITWYRYWWTGFEDMAETKATTGNSTVFVFEKNLTVPNYVKADGT